MQSVFGGALSVSVRLQEKKRKSVDPKDVHYEKLEKRQTGTKRDECDRRLFPSPACSGGGGDGHGRQR